MVAVVRAGSVGTLTAVAPLAVLSVACVVGLGANHGLPASAQDGVRPQPLVPVGSTFHTAAHLARHRASTPDQVQAAGTVVSSVSDNGVIVPPQAGQVPTAQPTAQPTAAPTTSPSLAPVPTVLPSASVPVSTPTATASPDPLTEAEATAQCLADGVSALDVVGLANCVSNLLNP